MCIYIYIQTSFSLGGVYIYICIEARFRVRDFEA